MKYSSVFSSFTASGDVHRHKVVHTGEKPHLCDICGRGNSPRSTDTKLSRDRDDRVTLLTVCVVVAQDSTT